MTRKLVVDQSAGLYLTEVNGVQQYTPIRNRRTAQLVASYFKHLGYTVIIQGEKRHMSLSTKQQEEMNQNHFEGLRAISAGERVHGSTMNALKRRGFVTEDGQITMTGRAFMMNFVKGVTEEAEPETVVTPAGEPLNAGVSIPAPVIVAPVVEPTPIQTNHDLEEATEVIHTLRETAMTLGLALARERVPELGDLFSALKEADRFLFKKAGK